MQSQYPHPYYSAPSVLQPLDAAGYGMPQNVHHQQMGRGGNIKMVPVDVDALVRTRDALSSAYMTLSSSIDQAVKAYIEHTNNVIRGDATLDVSYLTRPFDQLANTAQIARDALGQQLDFAPHHSLSANANANAVLTPQAPAPRKKGGGAEMGEKTSRRVKRPYAARDPNAPKRPQTAYFRYLAEQRPLVGKQLADRAGPNPQKPGDLSKEVTARWNAMSTEEQQPYRDAYLREAAEYEKKAAKYRVEGGTLTEKDMRILAASDKGDTDTVAAVGDEDEDDDDEDPPEVVDAKPVSAVASAPAVKDEDAADHTDHTDEDGDEDGDEESIPPPLSPPPAAKTPKSAMKKGKKEEGPQAPTPRFSSLNTTAPQFSSLNTTAPQFSSLNTTAPQFSSLNTTAITTGSTSSECKRKEAPTATAEESARKKRGQKSNGGAAASSEPAAAPVEPGKKKQKKRITVTAGSD